MGAAASWISAATPQTIALVLLMLAATLAAIVGMTLRLAKRVHEHGGGSIEIGLKAVGFRTKITFTPAAGTADGNTQSQPEDDPPAAGGRSSSASDVTGSV